MMKYLQLNLRSFAGSVAIIFIFTLLIIGGGGFISGKITEAQNRLDALKAESTVLAQKTDVLEQTQSMFLTASDNLITAVPQTDPTLTAISQLKSLANDNTITISNIKVAAAAASATGPVLNSSVTFNAAGNIFNLVAFMKGIMQMAPLSRVERFKISGGSTVFAETTVVSFYAPLPQKLPGLTENIQGLSSSDQALIASISALRKPQIQNLAPLAGQARSDPFSQ